MLNILTNLLKKKHHHPDCYASCRLIFLSCVCFASIYASTAAKSYILNYMWHNSGSSLFDQRIINIQHKNKNKQQYTALCNQHNR